MGSLTESQRAARLAIDQLSSYLATGEEKHLSEAYSLVQLAAPGIARANASAERPEGVPKTAFVWGANMTRSVIWYRTKAGAFIQYALKSSTKTRLVASNREAVQMFGYFNVRKALEDLKA